MAKIKRRAKHIEHDLHHDLEKIKRAIYDTTHNVKDRAGELFSESFEGMRDNAIEARENVSDYVSEKPLKSLGIALLSGVVLGYLLRK